MVVRDTPWPEGTPCMVQAMAHDVQRAVAFYQSLLGWQLTDMGADFGHYHVAQVDGRTVAGIGQQPSQVKQPLAWVTYLAVTDADHTAAKITESGGQLLFPPADVGEAGRMAVATDPAGAIFGLWQAKKTIGIELANVPGALVWNECETRDLADGKAFYANVFGYRLEDRSHDGASYTLLQVNDQPVGLLAKLKADSSPRWTVYFGVSDTDAAIAKVRKLDGTLTSGPHDTPFGQWAELTDDQGLPFNIISVGEQ